MNHMSFTHVNVKCKVVALYCFRRYTRDSNNLVIKNFTMIDTIGDLCCEISTFTPAESKVKCTELLFVGK